MKNAKVVRSIEKLSYIDVVRAIAILLVIILHTGYIVNGLSPSIVNLKQYGQMGVQLFFVTSAYTLCCSQIGRAGETKPLVSFFIRRFFRIAPLYYFAIVAYFILDPYIHILSKLIVPSSQYNLQSIIANIVFINGFVMTANNNIVPGGWSIGTEMAFYALFPMLFSLCSWTYKQRGVFGLYYLAGFSVFLNIVVQLIISQLFSIDIFNNGFIYFNIINQLPVFLLGITIFFHHQNAVKFRLSIPIQFAIFAFITVIITILLQSQQKWVFAFIPVCSGISFVFLLNILRELKYSNIFLERIGRVSYSMYIFHFIFAWSLIPKILYKIEKWILPELALVFSVILVTGLTFSIAVFSQKYIEAPGINFGKILISKL
jgi:peptidoglycan/LPS O-acetylase OafA/YrhL